MFDPRTATEQCRHLTLTIDEIVAQFDVVHSPVQEIIKALGHWELFVIGLSNCSRTEKKARIDVLS
jgi:hypothetical protein